MGWNEVRQSLHALWRDIADGARFYLSTAIASSPARPP